MADDLTIEVTGSAEKAASALDKIIAKIGELQARFDKAAPSVSKFAEQMDKIGTSSKAFSAFQKLADGADKQAVSTKKAEANIAMYQARLDRANVSMERSRVQSEKLAASLGKVSEAQKMAAGNSAAFSMPAADFASKYNHSGNGGVILTPQTSEETEAGPAPANAPVEKFDVSKIQSNIDSMKPKINIDADSAMAELQRMGEYIDSLRPRISGMSEEAQAQFNALAAKLELVSRQIDNQRNAYQGLQSAALKAEQEQGNGSDAYLKLEKRILSADAASQRLAATQEKLKAELAGVASGASAAGEQSERAARRSTSGWQKTFDMFGRMLVRIAAFKIYSAIAQGITTGLQDMALANSQANATMSALATDALYLKNSLAAALMPALQALVPIINQVTDALAGVFNTIGMLVARIFNHATTVTIAKRANVDYAATLDKTGDSASNTTKKVKELQNTVMGFDELNVLQKPTSDTDSTPKTPKNQNPGMPSYGSQFETVPIPGWVNQIGSWTDKISGFIKTNIDTIMRILRLAPLVIGAILAFSGVNVPLGIALMAVGAVLMAKQAKEDWDYLSNKTNSTLDKIKRVLQIVGAAELAIGAILAFSGANVPLGIALMIGGITTTAASLNWDSVTNQVRSTIATIAGIVGGALVALGVMMICLGSTALGVGMIIAGATSVASAVALDASNPANQVSNTINMIMGIVSGAALALGVLLVCLGIVTPLSIGLIVAGAAGIAASVAVNWNAILGKIKPILDAIAGFFKDAWSTIKGIWNAAPSWFGGIWKGIQGFFGGVGGWFKGIFSSAWSGIQSAWSGVTGWFGNIWGKILGFFKWNNLTDGFKRAWSALTSWHIPSPHISWGTGGWQSSGWIYNVLNALHLPTQMPKLNIDWYAQGGLFTAPSLVGVGEAGPEAALPLNDKVFSQIADGIIRNGKSAGSSFDTERIIQRMDNLEKAIKEIKVYLFTDDKKLADSVNRGNRLLARTHPTN